GGAVVAAEVQGERLEAGGVRRGERLAEPGGRVPRRGVWAVGDGGAEVRQPVAERRGALRPGRVVVGEGGPARPGGHAGVEVAPGRARRDEDELARGRGPEQREGDHLETSSARRAHQ